MVPLPLNIPTPTPAPDHPASGHGIPVGIAVGILQICDPYRILSQNRIPSGNPRKSLKNVLCVGSFSKVLQAFCLYFPRISSISQSCLKALQRQALVPDRCHSIPLDSVKCCLILFECARFFEMSSNCFQSVKFKSMPPNFPTCLSNRALELCLSNY